ncbi:MAG: SDR family oxidoreductase [Rhodocyclaceae bacterium]|nr:SDR family oxidoreductase [Rhodocyclaceae bacterium]
MASPHTARRVVITGASSGIGAALARAYARRGARLFLIGRNHERLTAVAASAGGDARCLTADVGDVAAMQACAEQILEDGTPDIVIANAGVSVGTLAGDRHDLAALSRVMQTNVIGLAASLQPFVAPMRARGRGTLVGIASVAGIRGLPGSGAYSASKAAAIALLESMRAELRSDGIRVVTIAPGYIDTPMTRVNRYPMPFLMQADTAAEKMLRAIERQRSYCVIPWQMGLVAKLLRLLPNPLFDRLFARAGRKPRHLPL